MVADHVRQVFGEAVLFISSLVTDEQVVADAAADGDVPNIRDCSRPSV